MAGHVDQSAHSWIETEVPQEGALANTAYDVRFTARMYIDHYVAQKGITVADLNVAPLVVLSWAPGVVRRMAETVGAEPASLWPWADRYPFLTGCVGSLRVSFVQVGIGAPATIAAMEEMIAGGARAFLALGWAGSLQPTAPIGTFLIPTSCLGEEGTSPHYIAKGVDVGPNKQLAEAVIAAAAHEGKEVVLGRHWTTDAPYRELTGKIEAYGRDGIVGVDMETSAMYALGHVRDVAVCNLLVISDELWDAWTPAFRTPELKAHTLQAERVVLRALEAIAAQGPRAA